MPNKVKEELKKMSLDELKVKTQEIRQAMFALKMKKLSAPEKDTCLLKKMRKNLACALTFMRQQEAANGN